MEFTEPENVEEDGTDELANSCEKYLIFTTGSKTYTPHQVGFKRIKNIRFPKKFVTEPSLRERYAQREMERGMENSNADWMDYESVADKFDKVDHVIDLHGHIIGMGLSPDHRYVTYVRNIEFHFDFSSQMCLQIFVRKHKALAEGLRYYKPVTTSPDSTRNRYTRDRFSNTETSWYHAESSQGLHAE